MKPTIPEVIDRFKQYHDANPSWGSLHLILDDRNTQDMFCAEEVENEARRSGDDAGAELISVLRSMSRTQRNKLAKVA